MCETCDKFQEELETWAQTAVPQSKRKTARAREAHVTAALLDVAIQRMITETGGDMKQIVTAMLKMLEDHGGPEPIIRDDRDTRPGEMDESDLAGLDDSKLPRA